MCPYCNLELRAHQEALQDMQAAGANDTVYIANDDENAISIADQSGTLLWAKQARLVWPDGLDVAPDGNVIVTVNQLNRASALNDGTSLTKKPYLLVGISENSKQYAYTSFWCAFDQYLSDTGVVLKK